jgi:hypothetical protein
MAGVEQNRGRMSMAFPGGEVDRNSGENCRAGYKTPLNRTIVKLKKVNGRSIYLFHAEKCAIFCVFTRKSAIQEIH